MTEAVISEVATDKSEYTILSNKIIDDFNIPDDEEETRDELSILTAKLDEVVSFIEDQNCECSGDPSDDACKRCKVLGRYDDEPI